MSQQPVTQDRPLKGRDPAVSLSPAHEALITILAEHVVEQYLAEEDGK